MRKYWFCIITFNFCVQTNNKKPHTIKNEFKLKIIKKDPYYTKYINEYIQIIHQFITTKKKLKV